MPSMSTVFISYSHKDLAFTQSLYSQLIQSGYNVWVDWNKISLADEWQQLVRQGIQLADLCLLIISPNFLASHGCALETEHILSIQKPILLVLLCAETLLPKMLTGCDRIHMESLDSLDKTTLIKRHL